jgi:hypothetical protein
LNSETARRGLRFSGKSMGFVKVRPLANGSCHLETQYASSKRRHDAVLGPKTTERRAGDDRDSIEFRLVQKSFDEHVQQHGLVERSRPTDERDLTSEKSVELLKSISARQEREMLAENPVLNAGFILCFQFSRHAGATEESLIFAGIPSIGQHAAEKLEFERVPMVRGLFQLPNF